MSRKSISLGASRAAFAGFCFYATSVVAAGGYGWIAAYVAPRALATSPVSVADLTIRQIGRFEAAGSRVRLVLGNQGGLDVVKAEHVRIALLDAQNQAIPGSSKSVTFGIGSDSVSLGAGAILQSDPVDLKVSRGQVAAITIYYPRQKTRRLNYVKESYSASGDHSADAIPITTNPGGGLRGLIQRIEVLPTAATGVLVAIGDSITAGFNSTAFAHRSYPEQLTNRFGSIAGGDQWSVVNAGISGNRVLHDANGPCLVARFSRDALRITDVKAVLVLEGINDIGHPADRKNETNPQAVTAAQITSAFRTLVKQAHERDVRIYFGTILPFGAAGYYSAAGEVIRNAVNGWIRTNTEADGYVEFEKVMLDPGSSPPRIKPTLSGNGNANGVGGLHPNDAGFGVMSQQIPHSRVERSNRLTDAGADVPSSQECLAS